MYQERKSIAVFSYNRGAHIINCIKSILACCESWEVVVYDDNSTSLETIEALEWCRNQGVDVISNTGESSPRGGLYSNMNRALANAAAESVDYLLFIQEDMQLVRSILESDLEEWKRLLSM